MNKYSNQIPITQIAFQEMQKIYKTVSVSEARNKTYPRKVHDIRFKQGHKQITDGLLYNTGTSINYERMLLALSTT